MDSLTEEQNKDIQDRETKFVEEYKQLIEKYQMDFMQYPIFIPAGNGTFVIKLVAELRDKKYIPQASPFSTL